MQTAFLFPGQGSQHAGMARDLFESDVRARDIIQRADDLLGFSLSGHMFDDGRGELSRTDITQPALYTHSMAVLALVGEAGLEPDVTAGHSLGEYSALAAAGAITFEDGLNAVRVRGSLMAEANERQPGGMAAVLGLEAAQVEQFCDEVGRETEGIVVPANYNAPGQVVVSGHRHSVERLAERASAAGARRVIILDVGGAFHSPLMAFAKEGLGAVLDELEIRKPKCPVVLNVTAAPTTDPDEIRKRMLEQLLAPVKWMQSLRRMQDDGVERFIEIGPGRVLSGLVKKTLGRAVPTVQTGTADNVSAWINEEAAISD